MKTAGALIGSRVPTAPPRSQSPNAGRIGSVSLGVQRDRCVHGNAHIGCPMCVRKVVGTDVERVLEVPDNLPANGAECLEDPNSLGRDRRESAPASRIQEAV